MRKKEKSNQTKRTNFNYFRKSSLLRYIDFSYKTGERGDAYKINTQLYEYALVLLSGKIAVHSNTCTQVLGPRKSVFHEKASCVHVGPHQTIHVTHRSRSEIILVRVPQKKMPASISYISPRKIKTRTVGRGSFRRRVDTILGEDNTQGRLLLGETFNEPGKGSSFPPHKHDTHNLPHESKLEELYFFKIHPDDKFGIMHIYGKKASHVIEKTYAVKHHDCIPIHFGYHPVCALPDTQLYYFWVLAGEKPFLRYQTDPEF